MDNEEIFTRTLTNAERAALILYLLDIGLPDWTGDENNDLVHVLCALTGLPHDASKRAFDDAVRFGLANKGERDDEQNG